MMQKFALLAQCHALTRFFRPAFAMLCAAICAVPAHAQSDKPAIVKPVQMAKVFQLPEARRLVVPVAKLMRVDEGVFELGIGKTIDLTDRKILLAVRLYGTRDTCCELTLNGGNAGRLEPGSRIDLKGLRSTAKFVEDKEICVLDVVDILLPKGAPGIATFRLHCI